MNPPETQDAVQERRQSLWLLTLSPSIWAAHFVLTYIAAALWCGRSADRSAGLGSLQLIVVGAGLAAIAAIALIGNAGWRRRQHGKGQPPYDEDTPEDRHRFLGFATVLLSALSGVATVYVTMSVLFIGNCY